MERWYYIGKYYITSNECIFLNKKIHEFVFETYIAYEFVLVDNPSKLWI